MNGLRFSRGASFAVVLVTAVLGLSSASQAAWSPPRTVAHGFSDALGAPVLATSARHGATVAWLDGDLFARRISRDGVRGPRRRLARRIDKAPSIAVTRSGGTVAVWSEDDALWARRLSPGGKLRRVQRITDPGGAGNYPPEINVAVDAANVAVDAAGNATIVWARVVVRSLGDPHNPFETISATAHARRLTAKGKLGPVIDLPGGGLNSRPVVAVAPSGQATVAWWHYDASSGSSIRVAEIGGSGIVGTGRDIAPAGGRADFTLDERGNVTVAWASSDLMAQRLGAGGALGAIHVLGPIDLGESEDSPRIALDRAGNATVVWLTAPGWSANSILSRRIGADDTLGPLWNLAARGGEEPDVAVDPGGNATATWVGMTPGGNSAILSRRVTRKGTLGKPRTIAFSRAAKLSAPRVVGDARGVVTAAWLDVLDRRYPQALIRVARIAPRAKGVHRKTPS
jgi:hypothetical protein